MEFRIITYDKRDSFLFFIIYLYLFNLHSINTIFPTVFVAFCVLIESVVRVNNAVENILNENEKLANLQRPSYLVHQVK